MQNLKFDFQTLQDMSKNWTCDGHVLTSTSIDFFEKFSKRMLSLGEKPSARFQKVFSWNSNLAQAKIECDFSTFLDLSKIWTVFGHVHRWTLSGFNEKISQRARDMTWRKSIADFQKFSSKIFQFGSRENRRRGFSGHEETNGVFRISKENLMLTFKLSRDNERSNLTTDEVGIWRCEMIEDW